MSREQETFDRVGDEFGAYYDTVRGYVREQLTRRNLAPFLGSTALSIVDIGGGAGGDAIWLAEQGNTVHLIDPSEEMVKKAEQAVAEKGLSNRIKIDCGDPEEVLRGVGGVYDLALSHGVLMYLPDPDAHLRLLKRAVKDDGWVSVLTKGMSGSLTRLLGRHDWQAAEELMKSGRLENNLGVDVFAVSPASMDVMLTAANLSMQEWFGVRVATDLDKRPLNEVSTEELATILEVEQQLGSDPSTKGLGQMLHFICKVKETA